MINLNIKRKATLLLLLVLLFTFHTNAQEEDEEAKSLEELVDDESEEQAIELSSPVIATFKTTRIANGHSVETVGKGVLDFRINHRFGKVNTGIGEFFGLDNAITRIGFDYGVTDRFMIGIGRSTYLKEYDGFVKYKLLRQTDDNHMPVTVDYLGSMSSLKNDITVPPGTEWYASNRWAFVNQLLIARKFSSAVSIQLMPTHVHYNFVTYIAEPNDVFAIGLGYRVKASRRIALTGEYYYQIPNHKLFNTTNSLTLGIDIETGGHVFQLMLTNSTGVTERTVIGQTTGKWGQGDIHFGFNISRVFTVLRDKEFRDSRNKIW